VTHPIIDALRNILMSIFFIPRFLAFWYIDTLLLRLVVMIAILKKG